MISIEQIREMFANMRREGSLDVQSNLLWGYFFTDTESEKLKPLARHLSLQGYGIVSIYPTDDGSTNFLHVEQIEKHTPETLNARNQELERLASEFGIESYDGMDVGPIKP